MFAKFLNGIENVIANLGTAKDKRSASVFKKKSFSVEELTTMYVADWLTRKIIDIPIDDAVRKWRVMKGLDADQLSLAENVERRLAIKRTIARAAKRGRLHGGCLVLLGIDNAGLLEEPLDPTRVGRDSLRFVKVIERGYVKPGPVNVKDPTAINFMLPEHYELIATKQRIHASRLLRFEGLDVPDSERSADSFWTGSVAAGVYDATMNSAIVNAAVSSLVHEAKVDWIQIKGLADMLGTAQGEELVRKRFAAFDKVKSLNNIGILDGDETLSRLEYTFTGLPDLMIKFLLVASSAADIPATRLIGQSAIGFSATGEGDLENYHAMVRSIQEFSFEPEVAKLDEVLLRSAIGVIPPGYYSEFLPLDEPSEREIAETDKVRADTDAVRISSGVITPAIAAGRVAESGIYSDLDEEFVGIMKSIDKLPTPGADETGAAP